MNRQLTGKVLEGGVLWLATFVVFGGMGAAGGEAGKPKAVRINAADYPNLQAAVDALPGRMGEVYLPRGEYLLQRTLDLSSRPGGYQGGIKLVGTGRGSRIVAKTRGQPVVDLTGTQHSYLDGSPIRVVRPF